MKKLLLMIVLFCGAVAVSHAQEFKAFRFDGGLGYAMPFSDGTDAGVLVYLEPKYAVASNISVGFRWEGAITASVALDGSESKADAKLNQSFMATGDYFFTNNTFRPFAGLGVGAYSLAGATANINNTTTSLVEDQTNFGLMLRAGFDASHFRLTVEYNFAGKDSRDESYNYLGIAIGFYIGGGKK